MNSKFVIFIVLLFNLIFSMQSKAESPLDTLNITSKIDYIIDNSNKYKEFKVVNKQWLWDLKSQISDSLSIQSSNISKTTSLINAQQKEIETLKETIVTTNTTLETSNSEKDKISLVGISLLKGTYNTIMFSTILLMLVLLLSYIFRFKTSNKSTLETKKNYSTLELDFEQFKKNSLEKEQKLKRQLQDEINKNARLTNNN